MNDPLGQLEASIEQKNNICINVFCYENDLVYPVYISEQKFEDFMDLLLINNENKSRYVCTKDFNRFMFNKTKHKTKKILLQILFTMF